MNNVYVVIATRDNEIETCEVFNAVQVALGRGFQLASNKSGPGRTDLFDPSPNSESLSDGSVCWTFMNTNKQSVVVYNREIVAAIPSQKDPASFLSDLSKNTSDTSIPSSFSMRHASSILILKDAAPVPPTPPYDFMNPTLPVGWSRNGKPVSMKDMLAQPFDIKDPLWDLTEDEQWALIEARIRKSPGFTVQLLSLRDLRDRTNHGKFIRDQEINSLHALREDLIAGTDHA